MKRKIGKDGFEILPPEYHNSELDDMFAKAMRMRMKNPFGFYKKK